MDDAPFLGAHRVHLDADVAIQRLLRGPVGTSRENLSTSLPVSGGIKHNPLAIAQPAESRLKAEQLERVDRLPSFPNQQPIIVLTADHRFDPLVVLPNLDLTVEVKLIENPLDELLNPLRRRLRPISFIAHSAHLIRASDHAAIRAGPPRTGGYSERPARERCVPRPQTVAGRESGRGGPARIARYRRRFFFFGGGGGGLAAAIASGVGSAGAGMNLFSAYC